MSYGIYDCDIFNGCPMFNLELMKLSSYYKQKGEIVAFSGRFRPERFNHFIVGKDRLDENFKFPIYDYNNIETIGRFFSPKKYYPMDLEIEKQIPDTYIYHKMPYRDGLLKRDLAFYKSQLQADHLRLSLDGEKIWSDYKTQFGFRSAQDSISIYDYNISQVEGAISALQELTILPNHKKPRPILFKYPVRFQQAQDMKPWLIFQYFQNRVIFIIERLPIEEDINFLIENQDKLKNKNIMFDISKNSTYINFNKNINKIYRQLYLLRTIYSNLSLIYDESFFQDKEWKDFITILNGFISNYTGSIHRRREPSRSLYYYVKRSINSKEKVAGITKEDAQKCFAFIAKHNYNLFKDFYEYKGEK